MLARVMRRMIAPGMTCLLAALLLTGPAIANTATAKAVVRTAPERQIITPRLDAPRFFTINRVLAKLDGVEPDSQPERTTQPRLATTGAMITTIAAPAHPFAQRSFELFGAPSSHVDRKWTGVRRAWAAEAASIADCAVQPAECLEPVGAFIAIRDAAKSAEGLERIAVVNRRVNAAVSYESDAARHGVADRWSALLATINGRGDCEDYAIAKYFLLKAAGIDDADIKLLLVRDRRVGEDHAVLAVREGADWHILDNRWDALHTDAELTHYRPAYALSESKVEMFAAPYTSLETGIGEDISPSAWTGGESLPAATQADRAP